VLVLSGDCGAGGGGFGYSMVAVAVAAGAAVVVLCSLMLVRCSKCGGNGSG